MTSPLSITADTVTDGVRILELVGEMDIGVAHAVRDAIDKALTVDRPTTLIVDLGGLTLGWRSGAA